MSKSPESFDYKDSIDSASMDQKDVDDFVETVFSKQVSPVIHLVEQTDERKIPRKDTGELNLREVFAYSRLGQAALVSGDLLRPGYNNEPRGSLSRRFKVRV
jgi:hypothetical protein